MTTDLAQKLQELKQLLDSGLLTPAEYERERETLLAAWRAAPASSVPAVSIDLNTLPTVVALPLREYLDETHPVLKLWYACDGVEMLLRLVVMMGLAVLSQRGPLTPKLRKRLQEYRLEEPTLGNWRALAEAVMEAVGDAPGPLPELPGLVRAALAPLLLGPGESERDESNSFIRLRNRLAHGGGISRALAQRLGEIWQPRLLALWEQLAWLAQVELVAQDGQGGYGVLRGPNPQAKPYSPRDPAALAQAFAAGDAVVLARGEALLPLWPLALYGPPRSPNLDAPPADEIVPQVYLRRGEVRLQYTPLGALAAGLSESEEHALERFLDWFKVADEPRARRERFQVRDFTDEMRKDGLRLIGREQECETLKNAVDERTEGLIWVSGKAGIGKSYLFAWLVLHLLDEPPPATLVLPYRFRAGDERCNQEAFLRFAVERLAAWLEVEVEDDSTPWLKRLRGLLGQLAGWRVVFLLDGLDEIATRNTRFAPEVPLALKGSGILWVCAGRPEYDLPAVFAAADAFQPFPAPDGLPGMDAGDIRTLLLERIGPLRKHLLRHDQEQGECIGNPFVEKVARAAADLPLYVKEKVAQAVVGVPLYVKYVIDDIFAGRYRVLDGHERLPPSLSAYYEELLRRLSVGDLHQVLTPLAATLAVALEPLDAPALAALLYRRGKLVPEGEAGLRLVERGLSAIASMLKRAPTPAGQDGYTLYHLSLRQHMATSEHSQAAVATAREVLGDLALDVTPDAAAPYLYRCGIAHLLETHRAEKALGLLTWFEYVMDRLRTLTDSEAVGGLGEDWRATVRHVGPLDHEQRLWQAFWQEREHILRRGDDRWPAYKILLQLAVEHADDSPVTRHAEAWLEVGHCDWVWLRNPQRIKHAAPNPCLRVFEGHTGGVNGALDLADGRIVSWSIDGTLRLWDVESGLVLRVLEGHTKSVNGALLLPNGHLLSWSSDKILRLWNLEYGTELRKLEGHTSEISGAMILPNGNILSWSNICDINLRLILTNSYKEAHEKMVTEFWLWTTEGKFLLKSQTPDGTLLGKILLLPNQDILGFGDGGLWVWSCDETPPRKFGDLINSVHDVTLLPDGKILSSQWNDSKLHLWDIDGTLLDVFEQRKKSSKEVDNSKIILLSNGKFLSCFSNGNTRIWNNTELSSSQSQIIRLTMKGAIELSNESILSWNGKNLKIWSITTGKLLATLKGHESRIYRAIKLPDGRILSWSFGHDHSLRMWSDRGTSLAVFKGHTFTVNDVIFLGSKRVLSWSAGDNNMRLWSTEIYNIKENVEHLENIQTGRIIGNNHAIRISYDGIIATWSAFSFNIKKGLKNNTISLWNINGSFLTTLYGHFYTVNGVDFSSYGHILSWSADKTLRLWKTDGTAIAIMKGHQDSIIGTKELSDGRILSWSEDSTLRLWSSDGKSLYRMEGHTNGVTGAKILSNDRILSWSRDNTLRLWNHDGTLINVLEGHTKWIRDVALLSDGRILSWSEDHTLRLWEAEGSLSCIFEGHKDSVTGAKILPNQQILSWSTDHTLRLWRMNGTLIATFEGHTDKIIEATLLFDCWRILSWSDDHTLRLWNVDGTCIATLKGHVGSIEGVERLSNRKIISWSSDHTLRLWDIDGTLLAMLDGHKRPIKPVSILYDSLVASYSNGENYFELLFFDIKKSLNSRASVIDIEPPVMPLKPDFQLAWHGNSSLPILLDFNIKLWIHELKNHKDSIVIFSDENLAFLQFNWGAKRINFHDIQRSQEEIDLVKIANDKAVSAYLLGDAATSIAYFSFIIGHFGDKLAASLNVDNDEVARIDIRKTLALAFFNRGIAFEMNDDLQSATQDLEQSYAICDELYKYLEPSDISIDHISEGIASQYWSRGNSEFDKNNIELARTYTNNAINLREKSRQRLEPYDRWPDEWAEYLANSYNLRLRTYSAAGNKIALMDCDQSIIIRERLRQRLEPHNQWPKEWAKELLNEYLNRGKIHFDLYHFSDAFIDYSQAIDLGKELIKCVKVNDSDYNGIISKLYPAYTARCVTGIGLLRLRSVPSDIKKATTYMIMGVKLSLAYQKLPRQTIRPIFFLSKFIFILCVICFSIYKFIIKLTVKHK